MLPHLFLFGHITIQEQQDLNLLGLKVAMVKTVVKAKRIAHILNRKAEKYMVPVDFDDWIEGLSEDDEFQIMSSSKKDNSKFK